MSDRNTKPILVWLLATVTTLLGAGGGAVAWIEWLFPAKMQATGAFAQDNFDSPIFVTVAIAENTQPELTVQANASRVVHNPHYGAEGWRLGSGVSLMISVDGKACTPDGQPTQRLRSRFWVGGHSYRSMLGANPKCWIRGYTSFE